MNLLFTISSLGKGGAERVLLGLANKFAKEGNNVTVLTMFDLTNAYPIDDKVKVKTISIKHFEGSLINKGFNMISRIFKMRRALKSQRNTDLIISFGGSVSVTMILAKATILKRMKCIVAVRNNPLLNYGSALRRFVSYLYVYAECVVVQNDFQGEIVKKFGPMKKIVQISNPVNIVYESNPYNPKTKKYTFLSIGRYCFQKRHNILIEAFAKVKKKYKNVSLCIIGKDDGLKNSMKELAISKGVEGSVSLLDPIDNIYELFENSEMYVHPSEFEGMPNALLEAMSCGLPCISSDFDGFNQIITPNLNNALVVERNNIDQLASNMETLYKDHHLRNKLSNTCFEDIKSNYTFDEIYIDWHNLITDLI